MRTKLALLFLPATLLLVACGDKADQAEGDDDTGTASTGDDGGGDGEDDDDGSEPADADADGYISVDDGGEDCDDNDPAVHPGAEETCNELDDDCDGDIDEDAVDQGTFYADTDGDGYGDPDASVAACAAEAGIVADATDCDDSDATANPGAAEVGCDGADNDCDGTVDLHTVPTEHPTLQAAVGDLEDGAEICVEPGTYTEQLDLSGRTLVFRGQGGAASTILDVGTHAPMISIEGESASFEAGHITLSGFTITGGEISADTDDVHGGFARVTGGTLVLSELAFSGMSGAVSGSHDLEGLLVYGLDSSLTLENVTAEDFSLALGGESESPGNIVGGLIRTVRGELTIDTMLVTGLAASGDATRSGCSISGAVLAADDNGTMNNAVPEHDGTQLSLSDLEISGSSLSVHCLETTTAGNLIQLTDTGGAVSGIQMTDNLVDVSANSRANASDLLYSFRLQEGSTFEVLDISDNTLMATAPSGGFGGLIDLDGTGLSHLSAQSNTFEFDGDRGSMGLLVGIEGGGLSHIDLRGNTIEVPDFASGLVEVFSEGSDAAVSNFVIAGNRLAAGRLYGSALKVDVAGGTLEVHNGDIVGNQFEGLISGSGYGLIQGGAEDEGDLVDLRNLQIVDNTYDGDGDGELAALATWSEELFTLSYSNLYGNADDTTSWGDPVGSDGNIGVDPLYTDVSGTDPTTWDLRLQSGSPAIDAGSPDHTDADGSTSDMGAYGGAGGSSW